MNKFFEMFPEPYRSDRLVLICAGFFPLLFSAFFFCDTFCIRTIFYISLPFLAALIVRERKEIPSLFSDYKRLFILVILFLTYMTASVFWSETDSSVRFFQKAKLEPLILLPLIGAALLVRKCGNGLVVITGWAYVASAILSGAYLLGHYMLSDPAAFHYPRLQGIGRTENPVQGGLLYGLAVASVLFLPLAERFKKQWMRPVLALIPFLTLCATQSRGPILAVFLSVLIAFVIKSEQRIKMTAVLFVSFVLLSIGGYFLLKDTPFIERGDTGRTQIWRAAAEKIADAPLIGHGLATKYYYEVKHPNGSTETAGHSHSLYISTVIQGGAIGFLLFSLLLAETVGCAVRTSETIRYFLWTFIGTGLLLGFVDFGGYIINVSSEWIVFWWPLAFILGQRKTT